LMTNGRTEVFGPGKRTPFFGKKQTKTHPGGKPSILKNLNQKRELSREQGCCQGHCTDQGAASLWGKLIFAEGGGWGAELRGSGCPLGKKRQGRGGGQGGLSNKRTGESVSGKGRPGRSAPGKKNASPTITVGAKMFIPRVSLRKEMWGQNPSKTSKQEARFLKREKGKSTAAHTANGV